MRYRVHRLSLIVSLGMLIVLATGGLLGYIDQRRHLTDNDRTELFNVMADITNADFMADDVAEGNVRAQAFAIAHNSLKGVNRTLLSYQGLQLYSVLSMYESELEKVPDLDTACAASRFPFFDALTGHQVSPSEAENISKPFFQCMMRRQDLEDTISLCRAQARWLMDDSQAPKPPSGGICAYRVSRVHPERK